jgi:hypothetical protein
MDGDGDASESHSIAHGAFSLHADAGAGGKDAKALFTSCKAVCNVRPALVSG